MDGLIFFEGTSPEKPHQFLIPVDDPTEIDRDFDWLWAPYDRKGDFPTARHVLVDRENGKSLEQSDYLGTSSTEPIFSVRAVQVLGEMLRANGKLFPLKVEGGLDAFAFAPQPIDAIDHVAAGWKEGSVSTLKRWLIKDLQLVGIDIFTNLGPYRAVGYSAAFVRKWNEAGLSGLVFKQRTGLSNAGA